MRRIPSAVRATDRANYADSAASSPARGPASRTRRLAWGALLLLVAITVALAVFTGVYLFNRASYAGQWVGPGNVQGAGDPSAVVASLSLEQNLLGGITGSGMLCVATDTATDGAVTQLPLTVTGQLSGSTASLTLRASGGETAAFPATLTAQGALDQGQLLLTAESPARLLLALQHGDRNDFSAACDQMSQPAPAS